MLLTAGRGTYDNELGVYCGLPHGLNHAAAI